MTLLQKFQKYLQAQRIEGAYLSAPMSHHYLTDYCDIDSRMIVTPRELFVITDARSADQVRQYLPNATIIDPTRPDFTKKFRAATRGQRIGIEAEYLTVTGESRLKKLLPRVSLVPIDETLHNFREIKTPHEVRSIARACSITHQAFTRAKKLIRPGMTERAIAWSLEKIMRDASADGLAFPSIIAIGSHSAIPHHIPTTRKLPRHGFVLLDFGCLVRGYHADMTRMIFLKKPTGKMKEIFTIVQNAQSSAIAMIRPNIMAKKIDNVARDIITRAGYGDTFTHSTGHGVGLEIHERPWINKTNTTKLKSGMVITVEPGIYLPGLGGVRIEDTLAITKIGSKILTASLHS